MQSQSTIKSEETEVASKRSVSLYPTQLEDAEAIRRHYRLRSVSAAIQRAIEDTASAVREQEREAVPA